MDIGEGSRVEIVDEFCYLGDMKSVDGDADAAVTARIHSRGGGGVIQVQVTSLLLAAKDWLPTMVSCCCAEMFPVCMSCANYWSGLWWYNYISTHLACFHDFSLRTGLASGQRRLC